MKNDFCALCAELLREFSSLYSDMSAQVDFNDAYLERTDALITRARAALAEPVGEGPTEALVDDLFNRFADSCDEYGLWSMGKDGLRAALTQQRANSRKAIDAIAAIGQEDENYGEDYGETQRLSNAVQSCLSQREEILSAFIAKYGFHPEMAVQIEQRQADGTSTWRIEKRPSLQTEEKGPTDDKL